MVFEYTGFGGTTGGGGGVGIGSVDFLQEKKKIRMSANSGVLGRIINITEFWGNSNVKKFRTIQNDYRPFSGILMRNYYGLRVCP